MEQTQSVFVQSCPVGCQAQFRKTAIHVSEGTLLQCATCGQLISQCTVDQYWSSMKEFNTSDGTFPTGKNWDRHVRRNRKLFRYVLRLMGNRHDQIDLLDVGCSNGALLVVAKDLGLRVSGVEPAEDATASARNRGLDVHHGYLEDVAIADSSIDIVTLMEVIEHTNAPITLLNACFRVLKPSGLLVIGTGNADSWTVQFMKERWEYFHIEKHGGHVSFFCPQSFRVLAQRTGFKLKAIQTRRVCLYERPDTSPLVYRSTKILCELLGVAARLCGKGHDMLVVLEKPGEGKVSR